jgi:hypothetical protein
MSVMGVTFGFKKFLPGVKIAELDGELPGVGVAMLFTFLPEMQAGAAEGENPTATELIYFVALCVGVKVERRRHSFFGG